MRSIKTILPLLLLLTAATAIIAQNADARLVYTTITVYNTAGVPQADTDVYDTTSDQLLGTSDGGGIVSFTQQGSCKWDSADPNAACIYGVPMTSDQLTLSRSEQDSDDPCTIAPEGWPGQPLSFFSHTGKRMTNTQVPAVAGTAYQPALSNEELGLVGAINQERIENGETPVTISSVLSASADKYLSDLPDRPLDPDADSTYCMASGPGIRAIDAGFPTGDDIGEDVIQSSPNAYAAMTSLDNYSSSGALDGDITLIGVAQEGDRWVIDTSDLQANDPYYARAGDTENLGDYSLVASEFPVDDTDDSDYGDADTGDSDTSATPLVKDTGLSFQKVLSKKNLFIVFTLRKHSRGKLRIIVIDKKNRKNKIVASYAKHPKHKVRLHARRLGNKVKVWGRLHRGKWLIKAHFVPDAGSHWQQQSVRRSIRIR